MVWMGHVDPHFDPRMSGAQSGKNRFTEPNGRPRWWSAVTCLVGNCLCPRGSRGPRSTVTVGQLFQEGFGVTSRQHPPGY